MWLIMKIKNLALVCTIWFFLAFSCAFASTPLICVGGGYFFGGKRHSSEVWQIEYRAATKMLNLIRPQVVAFSPHFNSLFFGIGLGLEIPLLRNVLFIPSFSPGLYCKGGGKDLGYPIEFRSAAEICYEFCNGVRIGGQIFHVSNASLSNKNPGANNALIVISIPLKG